MGKPVLMVVDMKRGWPQAMTYLDGKALDDYYHLKTGHGIRVNAVVFRHYRT